MIRGGEIAIDEIIDQALDAGYDIEVIREDIEKVAARAREARKLWAAA